MPNLLIHNVIVDEDAGIAEVSVSLDRPASSPVSLAFATQDGSATAGLDFQATAGTVSFSHGDTTQSITVPLFSDLRIEGDEQFSIDLTNAVGATMDVSAISVTIVDVDPGVFQNVRLARDTGTDREDKITIDPRIFGRIARDFGDAELAVEFDHNNNGIVDATLSIASGTGEFLFDPHSSNGFLPNQIGAVIFHYRLVINPNSGGSETLDWNPFEFFLEDVPMSNLTIDGLATRVQSLDNSATSALPVGIYLTGRVSGQLFRERALDFSAPSQACSSYAAGPYEPGYGPESVGSRFDSESFDVTCEFGDLAGSEINDNIPGKFEPMTIEIDLDSDGVPDMEVIPNGNRRFDERLQSLLTATNTVSARVREYSVDMGVYLTGHWQTISIAAQGVAGPTVESAQWVGQNEDENSNSLQIHPTLHGVFSDSVNHSGVITVEIDLDGDGQPDQYEFANSNREFTIEVTESPTPPSQSTQEASSFINRKTCPPDRTSLKFGPSPSKRMPPQLSMATWSHFRLSTLTPRTKIPTKTPRLSSPRPRSRQ